MLAESCACLPIIALTQVVIRVVVVERAEASSKRPNSGEALSAEHGTAGSFAAGNPLPMVAIASKTGALSRR